MQRLVSRLVFVTLAVTVVIGCKEAPVGTEVVVVVDSDLATGTELSKLEVQVLDRGGEGEPLRSLTLPLSEDPSGERLPLSFSIVPSAQHDTRDFRVVVTGVGKRGPGETEGPVVEQQAIARFQPSSARRLDIFLARRCAGQLCWNGDRRIDRTCEPASGECGDVPLYTSLPQAGAGPLSGYESTDSPSGALDAGDAAMETQEDPDSSSSTAPDAAVPVGADSGADAGEVPVACVPDPCSGMPNKTCEPKSGLCICAHKCEAPEVTRCNDGMLSVCRADADGCRDWQPLSVCAMGCADARACAGCSDECAEAGRGECVNDGVRLCVANAHGCLVLGEVTACTDTHACTDDRCNPQTGRCESVQNDTLCTGHAGNVCVRDYCDKNLGCQSENTSASCDDGVACTSGDSCKNGVCAGTAVPSCGDLCPADPAKTAPGMCGCGVAEQTGDRDRDGIIDCRDSCPDDQCAAAGVSCTAASVRTCKADAQGCRTLTQRACTGGACYDATRCTKTTVRNWAASEAVYPYAVAADAQGNAYAVGMSTSAVGSAPPRGSQDVFITKWSANGTRLWDVTWGSDLPEHANDVAVNAAGDRIAVAGTVNSQVWVGVWSTAAAGTPLWTITIPSPEPYAQVHGVVYGPGGDVYIAGRATRGALPGQTSAGMHDAFAMRLNATTGATVWASQWGTANNDGAFDIASDGTFVYVAGVRNFISETQDTTSGDAFLRKLNASGAVQWERVIDNGQRDWAKAVAVMPSGDAVVAGISYGADGQGLLARITSNNTLGWSEGVTIQDDVELDAAGNVYATFFATLSKHSAGTEVWSFAHIPVGQYTSDLAIHESAATGVRVLAVGFDNSGTTPRGLFAVTAPE